MTQRMNVRIYRKVVDFALARAMPRARSPVVARTDLAGDEFFPEFDLAQYRGKVVYVAFWTAKCAPCKLAFAFMNVLQRFYSPKDLVILTINGDRDRAAAVDFLNAAGGQLPVIYDPAGALARHFQVASTPTFLLFGRDGQQRCVQHGYQDIMASEYAQQVASLVAAHG